MAEKFRFRPRLIQVKYDFFNGVTETYNSDGVVSSVRSWFY